MKILTGEYWSRTHSHFLQMGGLRLRCTAEEKKVYIPTLGFALDSQSPASRTRTVNGSDEHCFWEGTITLSVFKRLLKDRVISFPIFTEDEINDRSKSSLLTKAVASLHILWFIFQTVTRLVMKLAITQLEIATVALAVINISLYYFWINKPLDARYPITIYSKSVERRLVERQGDEAFQSPKGEEEEEETPTRAPHSDRGLVFPFALLYSIIWLPFMERTRRISQLRSSGSSELSDDELSSLSGIFPKKIVGWLIGRMRHAKYRDSNSTHEMSDSITPYDTFDYSEDATLLNRRLDDDFRSLTISNQSHLRFTERRDKLLSIISVSTLVLQVCWIPILLIGYCGLAFGFHPMVIVNECYLRDIDVVKDRTDSVATRLRDKTLSKILLDTEDLQLFLSSIFYSESDLHFSYYGIYASSVGMLFAAIHATALWIGFPSSIEESLWIYPNAVLFLVCLGFAVAWSFVVLLCTILQWSGGAVERKLGPLGQDLADLFKYDLRGAIRSTYKPQRKFWRISKFPALFFTADLVLALYGLCRIFLLILAYVLLYSQPASAFEGISWLK